MEAFLWVFEGEKIGGKGARVSSLGFSKNEERENMSKEKPKEKGGEMNFWEFLCRIFQDEGGTYINIGMTRGNTPLCTPSHQAVKGVCPLHITL